MRKKFFEIQDFRVQTREEIISFIFNYLWIEDNSFKKKQSIFLLYFLTLCFDVSERFSFDVFWNSFCSKEVFFFQFFPPLSFIFKLTRPAIWQVLKKNLSEWYKTLFSNHWFFNFLSKMNQDPLNRFEKFFLIPSFPSKI